MLLSEGKKTKSSPFGTVEMPLNPLSLALGAEASFVARSIDMDRDLTADVLREASSPKGAGFVEIYQKEKLNGQHQRIDHFDLLNEILMANK